MSIHGRVLGIGLAAFLGCGDDGGADGPEDGGLPYEDLGGHDGQAADAGPDGVTGPCAGSACGGDPTGVWEGVALCVGVEEVNDCGSTPPSTPGSIVYRDVVLGGTMEFVHDGSVEFALTLSATIELTLPDDCTMDCDEYWELQFGATPTNCVTEVDHCTCSESIVDEPLDESGTWSVSGTNLDFGSIGGVFNDPVPFCVDGDGLWFQAGRFTYVLTPQ